MSSTFAANAPVYSSGKTSIRNAIKAELAGKVKMNCSSVYRRLQTEALVHDRDLDACLAAYRADATVQNALNELKRLEASQKHEEKDMYPHLLKICEFIRTFTPPGSRTLPPQCNRELYISDEKEMHDDGHTFAFPKTRIDLSWARTGAARSARWGDQDAFMEVKASINDGPYPPGVHIALPSVIPQAADYARLLLSARPFFLYCVAMFVAGSQFCVGIIDRDGMTVSPPLNIHADAREFIRVVRAISCKLTITELGQDPTVVELDMETTGRLTGQSVRDDLFPSFLIDPIPGDELNRRWCTVGPPMWSSLSLLGRGTTIYRVREYMKQDGKAASLKGKFKILKTAWRSSHRDSEAAIYRSVPKKHPGVADFLVGADILDPRVNLMMPASGSKHVKSGKGRDVITVRHLREEAYNAFIPTPTLHRLIVNTVGRPIWTYTSDLELVKGLRAGIEGHRFLCNQGILHRDISPGNILLAEDPSKAAPGGEAFITDLEFAWIDKVAVEGPAMSSDQIPSGKQAAAKRGAVMTGTLHFMARDLLYSIVCANNPAVIATYAPRHDLESFVWVSVYTVMRKLSSRTPFQIKPDKETVASLDQHMRHSFGLQTVENIYKDRLGARPFDFISHDKLKEYVERAITLPLRQLFGLFREWALLRPPLPKNALPPKKPQWMPNRTQEPPELTHDFMAEYLNDCISELEQLH